jgi:hypothetical protein
LYFWINPAILRYDAASMYFGTGSWSVAYDSILGALFDDFIPKLAVFGTNQSPVPGLEYFPLFLAVFVLAAGLSILGEFLIRRREGSSMETRSRIWVLIFSVLSLTIGLHTALHFRFGVLLPLERTGIYFVPLSILLASVSIERFVGMGVQRIARTLGRLGIAVATIYFLTCLHTDYFRQWKYDAGSKDVFFVLSNLSADRKYDSIGISWTYEPSLNFYRTLYKADDLPEFTRDPPSEHQSLFVLDSTSGDAQQFITQENLSIVYQNPLSGAVVATK